MAGVWQVDDERLNKYLVLRRDGTMPQWPWLVMAASDPAVPYAIHAYAEACADFGMDKEYVDDLHKLADKFAKWREENWEGDPDAARHRTDDPEIVAKLNEKAP